MSREFSKVISLPDGMTLLSSKLGDQYFVEDRAGSKFKISIQKAAILIEEARKLEAGRPDKPKTRRRKDPLPMTREEIEAAATYLLKTVSAYKRLLENSGDDFDTAVQKQADRIERDLHKALSGLDPRDRTPELSLMFFKGAAAKILNERKKKEQ